jgi:hypothetical protein
VIPHDYITSWRAKVPWVQDFQVEQDLVISRALVEIFSNRQLATSLAFRGGTALNKLHMSPPVTPQDPQGDNLVFTFCSGDTLPLDQETPCS